LQIFDVLSRVASKTAPGRFPSFAEAHVIMALERICLEKQVGRQKLARDLHLGEGEARTLVKHLRNEDLIDVSKLGIILSTRGRELLSVLRTVLSEEVEVPHSSLTVGPFNVAVRVTGMRDSIKYGLEQRDAAIMVGAKGATTLIFTKRKLCMPGASKNASKIDTALASALLNLNLREGDVVIIGSGNEKIDAELGARAAAIGLLKSNRRFDFSRRAR
jgi:hypothetical protein